MEAHRCGQKLRPLWRLDDVLEELHGGHYTFILSGKEHRCERVKWTGKLVSVCQALSYLLAGFYKLVDSHHPVSVAIHFLGRIYIEKKKEKAEMFIYFSCDFTKL